MLTSTSSTKQAPVKVTIGALFLAKATRAYPAWRRAEDAARWMKGEVVITPTAKLACAIFRISYPRLKQAQTRLERNKHHVDWNHVDGNGSTELSDGVVERIVAEVGIERIWRALDKLTQPQLPLQAAE
jgi:hypothetical protein